MSTPVVTHNPQSSRYEAHLDGELAGFAEYKEVGDVLVFDHTVVEEAFGGRGVASALARGALDQVREQEGRKVRPECPFIAAWIEKHPDYRELVAS